MRPGRYPNRPLPICSSNDRHARAKPQTDMDEHALLSRLAVSLAIGLVVGLERGWRTRDEDDHQRAAGLRTFALSGLLGGVTGA
ncbi:MgtC/SapB family protein, partial [Cupriavidus sp. 2MCAB6]|uniref:MgtC/SapB family protein n=1 Tax=Cupriavidus sp. 2MCAB6 TaxID=3232981 RepID=UPI003F928D56